MFITHIFLDLAPPRRPHDPLRPAVGGVGPASIRGVGPAAAGGVRLTPGRRRPSGSIVPLPSLRHPVARVNHRLQESRIL